ncbi:hypothetical protein [Nitrosophilus kaiyonis]|uniref:hypothetical protein n=1 Tax=Nitrosophilus kaiyonis TaxID=2930200 RepID=UPI00248FB670|nr:hypothetical protein [Nitrosophilus kaiyonis]
MLILNHPKIEAPKLYKISSIDDIKSTPSNSIVWFDFDFDILNFCKSNEIKSAVNISNIKEAVYANSLDAYFLICKFPLAKDVQTIAQNYLFDSKVIALIDERLIENAIEAEIDGVFLTNYPF